MKEMTSLAILCSATLMFVGCGDTYDSAENTYDTAKETTGSLQRDVDYLTDVDGNSLYTFDNDNKNETNCDAGCQDIWPIFTGSNTQSEDIQVFDIDTSHLAYRGHPLYYYIDDTVAGDVNGDGVNEVWHLVYAPEGSADSQTAFSDERMTQTYLTDADGRALYTFDDDTNGTSACYAECEAIWPVFYQASLQGVPSEMDAADFTTISRDADLSTTGVLQQTAYKGRPLYYFTPDEETSGSTKGDWVNGVWHLVEISAQKSSENAPSIYTEEAALRGKEIFTDPAKCSSCHGVDGQTKPLGVDNIIARYGDAALIDQKLKDMRDNGNPSNRDAAMVNIASGLSDQAIIDLSAFVATLKQ